MSVYADVSNVSKCRGKTLVVELTAVNLAGKSAPVRSKPLFANYMMVNTGVVLVSTGYNKHL